MTATGIDSLTIAGARATITGRATVDGVPGVSFFVEVEDLGSDADAFRIVLGDGYAAGGVLLKGNVVVTGGLPDSMTTDKGKRMTKPGIAALAAVVLAGLAGAVPTASSSTDLAQSQRYLVVLAGVQGDEGFTATGTAAAVSAPSRPRAARSRTTCRSRSACSSSSRARRPSRRRSRRRRSSTTVGKDKKFKGLPDGGPEQTADPLEPLQWDMEQIRAPQAHNVQAGARSVDVGILDSGIDGQHPDFVVDGNGSNVDCARGRNSVSFLPSGPGVGSPDPCIDNQFHGTHVAGTVAAQANGIGVVGVAPNVTLVPVKVCDASGYCYVSAVVDGLTYAGDIKLDVINMSFFVDDDAFQESTEFKCNSDPTQRAFRQSVERAIRVRPRPRASCRSPRSATRTRISAIRPPPTRPTATSFRPRPTGVIGVSSLGPQSEKAGYSNYGVPANDVAAPGGNGTTGDCTTTILSTLPGGSVRLHPGHVDGVAARGRAWPR